MAAGSTTGVSFVAAVAAIMATGVATDTAIAAGHATDSSMNRNPFPKNQETSMSYKTVLGALALFTPIALAGAPALAHEEHGHCSGPAVCKGDATCEKQGYKELTKDECAKISGAKFEASDHKGENHKHDDAHDHKK